MPALVGPFVGFALGAALAWLGRVEAAREDEAARRARALVAALFGALVFAPACAYFIVFAGDWAIFYLADSRSVPSALDLLLVLADALSVAIGFLAGHRAARAHADGLHIALWAAPAGVAAVTLLACLSRLRVDGTYHQVTSRFGTQPVAGGPLGWAILWMGAMIVAGFVVAARVLAERPRLPRAPAPMSDAPPQPILGRRR